VFIQQLHCNQPIMFILDWRGRFFGYHINQPSMDGAALRKSVFASASGSEDELWLSSLIMVKAMDIITATSYIDIVLSF
jgi:hypothetical protein